MLKQKKLFFFAAETLCSTGRQQWTISAAALGGRSRKLSSATVHPSTALSSSEEPQNGQEHPELVSSHHSAAAAYCKITDRHMIIEWCPIYPNSCWNGSVWWWKYWFLPVYTTSHTLKNKRSAVHLRQLAVDLSRYRQHRLYNWTHNKAAEKKRYLFWQHMVRLLCPTLLHSVEMTCKEQHLFEHFDICQQ